MQDVILHNSQCFGVKRREEFLYHDEAIVGFQSSADIHNFFINAVKSPSNRKSVQRIAREVYPSYCCRSIKYRQQPSDQELLENLVNSIKAGSSKIVLKNNRLVAVHKPVSSENPDDENIKEKIDLCEIAQRQIQHLKKIYSEIVHTYYDVIEKVIHIPEDSPAGSTLVVVDPSTIQGHSTGWKDWDDPFEIGAFGAFKGLVVFNIAKATKLSNSAFLAAAASYLAEGVKCQYEMTGKSIICREWHGSYCLRFNIKTWNYEIAWVKYKKSGPNQRILIELNRANRVVKDDKVLYSQPPKVIKPLITMEQFLSDYRDGFVPTEHDINTPIGLR